MKLRVLGASAGIGGTRRTLCLQLGDGTLIDAGTGAGTLELQDILGIEHVFLTHSHLDHIALLPMLADAAANFRTTSLTVHALPATWQALQKSVFNGLLWPDYTRLPAPDAPYIRFAPLAVGQTIAMGGFQIRVLPAVHAVESVAYAVMGPHASLAYSADTTLCPAFWQALTDVPRLRQVMLECTFRDSQTDAATRAGHMTPALLQQGLAFLPEEVEVGVLHMEPGMEALTLSQIAGYGRVVRQICEGDEFEL